VIKRLEMEALKREIAAITADLVTNPDRSLLLKLQQLKTREHQLQAAQYAGPAG